VVVPKLAVTDLAVVARFGGDPELNRLLARGELDVALTRSLPAQPTVRSIPLAPEPLVLVAAPGMLAGAELSSLDELGEWLNMHPWIAYNPELPGTRIFWQQHLDRPFAPPIRLTVPDVHVVLGAVERGIGCSILHSSLCAGALKRGDIVEVYPISELIAPVEMFVSYQQEEATRPSIATFVELMTGSSPPNASPTDAEGAV
jgi:DNA-binding transcriptional LysR family regulator